MQRVVTPDGWIIALHIRNGLAYMDMRPPTQDEYDTFDHVTFTSDVTWDPTVLDDETDLTMPNDNLIVDIDEEYYDARSSDTGEKSTTHYRGNALGPLQDQQVIVIECPRP